VLGSDQKVSGRNQARWKRCAPSGFRRSKRIADFWQDLRFGARMLIIKPGFTLAAALALALGIGANTAIFSVIMTVLARPLPFGEPDTLVYLWNTNPALGARQDYFRDDDILAFRDRATSCAQVTSWLPFNVNVKGVRPERVEGMIVETNFFQTLGVQPLLGRAFTDDDDEDGVVIGYGLLLALAGGALGLLLALWPIYVVRVMAPASIPRLQEVTINAQALWFTPALSILTGVLFGLAPSCQSSNPDLHHALKDSGLLATASARGRRFRQALIVSQVAISLALLIGAGLLIKSFWQARQINLGFATEHVLTATVSPSVNDYSHGDWRRTAFYQKALARIESLPGVVSAGAISQLPLGGREVDMTFEIKGRPNRNAEKEQHAELRIITPSYFGAFGIPLRSGRLMTDRDTKATPLVIIVNEAFARRYFPGRTQLGERLKFSGDYVASVQIIPQQICRKEINCE